VPDPFSLFKIIFGRLEKSLYNLFMDNIDKFDIPVAEIKTRIDLILLEKRLEEFGRKIEDELEGK